MKNLERIFKAFANKRRLAILAYLKNEKEASVGEIAVAIRLSLKATSKHLAILIAADFLDREQRSLQMFYRLNPSAPAATKHILSLL